MFLARRSAFLFFFMLFLFLGASLAAAREAGSFSQWLEKARYDARSRGISERTVSAALSDNIKVIPRILELDRAQPEKRLTFNEYKKNTITQRRVFRGWELGRKHATDLSEIERAYGVQRSVILALWGMETDFGRNTGGFGVVEALATLAFDGRRHDFFYSELMHALKILDDGHIAPAKMKGSWAGAMGQSQFMPSSFLKFAVDRNGDGRRDIWYSEEDVFASIANYLSQSGWRRDERWGRPVTLPRGGVPASLMGLDTRKPLSFWRGLGIMAADGQAIADVPGMEASLIVPDDRRGEQAYLVYENFRVLMKWNNSRYFATSVGLLADRL